MRSRWMRVPVILAAAAVLVLSAHAATACDDYADEMAMAEAQRAAKLAQTPMPQQGPSAQTAAPAAPDAQTATGVAAVDPKPAEAAGTVQR